MFKFFSNTILSYLELDINDFIKKNNCTIVNVLYNISVVDGELMHCVLLYYT